MSTLLFNKKYNKYNKYNIKRAQIFYITIVLGLMNFSLSVFMYFMAERERVVIVPPIVNSDFWIATDSVSDSYLEQMTAFFSGLFLNINASNFAKRRDQFLHHVDPTYYAEIKAEMIEKEIEIHRAALSSVFHPTTYKIDRKNLRVEVQGELTVFLDNRLHILKQSRTYQMRYLNRNGRLYIVDFREV